MSSGDANPLLVGRAGLSGGVTHSPFETRSGPPVEGQVVRLKHVESLHRRGVASVYAVRVVTNTVQIGLKRLGSAMRALKSGCAQLGLRCDVSTSTASVMVENQRFDVVLTERVSDSHARGFAQTAKPGELLVAQRITEEARVILRQRNVSFFDERGYLSIRRTALVVEAVVAIAKAPSTRRRGQPLAGIGLDVALWLLHTREPGGVRAISRRSVEPHPRFRMRCGVSLTTDLSQQLTNPCCRNSLTPPFMRGVIEPIT